MRRVRLSPSAERDLEAIDDWIAADDPTAARRVLHGSRDLPSAYDTGEWSLG